MKFLNRRKSAVNTTPDQQKDSPPSYLETVAPQLSFQSEHGILEPLQIFMKGESRSSNFKVETRQGTSLYTIETISNQVNHESQIKDSRPEGRTWFMKRKVEGDLFTYTIVAHSTNAKVLEIQTTSKIMSGSSTRLVFRGFQDDELDALHLEVGPDGPDSPMAVVYSKEEVGHITRAGSEKEPYFLMNIRMLGIDPILFVVFALVIDDRRMTTRRRLNRSKAAGMPGGWNGVVRSVPVVALGI